MLITSFIFFLEIFKILLAFPPEPITTIFLKSLELFSIQFLKLCHEMSLVILFKVLTVPILNDFVSMILFLEIRFNSCF